MSMQLPMACAILASTAAPLTAGVIDFDGLDPPATAGPDFVVLTGAEFAGLTIVPITGDIIVANPSRGFFSPDFDAGDVNVFSAYVPSENANVGIAQFDFDVPITSLSADFLDVEASFAEIGFDLDLDNAPDVTFNGAQGNGSSANLSANFSTPLSSVRITFGTLDPRDGTAIDNLTYTPIPEACSVASSAVFALFAMQRRARCACGTG